jgi:hypothetical protein
MEMNVEKFLALTALLAASALPACTVTEVDSGATGGGSGTAGKGITAGSAGSSASTGGGAGSASTEGTDDAGTVSDAAGDASVVACFPEGPATDGAVDESKCGTLPYADNTCVDGDAGAEGATDTLGFVLCSAYQPGLKPAAFNELFDCLNKAPGVADGGAGDCTAHDAAAALCSKNIFNRSTCLSPDAMDADGGALGCKQLVASCPALSLANCQAWLAPLNADARQGMLECGMDPALEGEANCAKKFENACVFPPL